MSTQPDFCGVVHVMYAARFVERAPRTHMFTRPTHPYTEALLASVPRPGAPHRAPLEFIPGTPPDLASLPAGCPFQPRCRLGAAKAICVDQTPPPVELEAPAGAVIAELFTTPLHPYTSALLSATPEPELGSARRRNRIILQGDPSEDGAEHSGCPVEPRCPVGRGRDLCRTVRPALRLDSGDHLVACHFPGETPATSERARKETT